MRLNKLSIILSFLFLSACTKSPEKINYGFDSCQFCQMNIVDPKFASELITTKGKIYKFDSIECLAAFYSTQRKEDIHSAYVSVLDAKNFFSIEKVLFIKSELKSPMGLNLAAVSESSALTRYKKEYNAKKILWKDVLDYVKNNWD